MKKVDVFPAVVRVIPPGHLKDTTDLGMYDKAPEGTRQVDRCRVVVVQDRVLIARDSVTGPEIIFREKVEETRRSKKTTYIKTVSGKILMFTKDTTCGCGSRLRSWNPYGNFLGSSDDSRE